MATIGQILTVGMAAKHQLLAGTITTAYAVVD